MPYPVARLPGRSHRRGARPVLLCGPPGASLSAGAMEAVDFRQAVARALRRTRGGPPRGMDYAAAATGRRDCPRPLPPGSGLRPPVPPHRHPPPKAFALTLTPGEAPVVGLPGHEQLQQPPAPKRLHHHLHPRAASLRPPRVPGAQDGPHGGGGEGTRSLPGRRKETVYRVLAAYLDVLTDEGVPFRRGAGACGRPGNISAGGGLRRRGDRLVLRRPAGRRCPRRGGRGQVTAESRLELARGPLPLRMGR